MQKWRYHTILMRDLAIADSKLNAEAERGWELITVCLIDANTARAFFRAPVEPGEVVAEHVPAASAAHTPE